MKIAMWSGPRNLSTAMMYAFGNRADCEPWDEPFYSAFLAQSRVGRDHPMWRESMEHWAVDELDVIADVCETTVQPVRYLKLMTHHMLPHFPLEWAESFTNAHLIRHPARVIASYAAKRRSITMADIGYAEIDRIYKALPGPILDSADVRADPEGLLRALCHEIGLTFDPAMLAWETGPKPFDGPWAAHWYDAVHRSTGIAGAEGPLPEVAQAHRPLLEAAMPIYDAMRSKRLRP